MGYFIGSDHSHIDYHKSECNIPYEVNKTNTSEVMTKVFHFPLHFKIIEHVFDSDNNYLGSWFGLADETIQAIKGTGVVSSCGLTGGGGTWKKRVKGTTQELTNQNGSMIVSDGTVYEVYWEMSVNGAAVTNFGLTLNGYTIFCKFQGMFPVYYKANVEKEVNYGTSHSYYGRNYSCTLIQTSSSYPLGMQYASDIYYDCSFYGIQTVSD